MQIVEDPLVGDLCDDDLSDEKLHYFSALFLSAMIDCDLGHLV
jgi:hypothetical protein